MMKRTLVLFVLMVASLGCSNFYQRYERIRFGENPYVKPPFYARYLNPSNPSDQQIQQLIDVLRDNPYNAAAHNELGALLAAKGFPNDARREFRRAVASDPEFHPAWYNLALIQEGKGDLPGATRALRHTLALKPGHAAAHFQLGLIYEKRGQKDRAVEHYAKALRFNRALLSVKFNPRVVDTELLELALLKLYETEHARGSLQFQATPADYVPPTPPTPEPQAPSAQPRPEDIVTPTPPVTAPSQQPTLPPPPPPGQ